MKSMTTKWYSIITGTIFLLLILIVLILIPCPTNPQLNFFRIFIAVAAAAFAATIPGSIKVTNKFVVATSSIGVFVLVYLINPAGWNNSGDCNLDNLKVTVYLDEKLTKGVEITIPDIGQSFLTDEFGNANIEYATAQIKFPARVIFKYKSELDTTVVINDKFERKMEFKFFSKAKGTTTIENNSVNYTYQDINLNVALLNPNNFDVSTGDDTVSYVLKGSQDTIIVYPTSKLINQIASNDIVDGFVLDDDIGLDINMPQFDFKFTNNSSDAIFLTQILLTVDKSVPNNNALLVPCGMWNFSIYNFGWGDAKNIKVDFSTTSDKLIWDNPFEEHIELSVLKSATDTSLGTLVENNLIRKGVSSKFFNGDFSLNLEDTEDRAIGKKLAGDFIDGATVYGKITYSDANNINKEQRFKVGFDVNREGYGAGMDLSNQYNTALKATGDNYQLAIPISNTLKPKDFERFSLIFASTQSSSHYFHVTFLYNDKQFILPYTFNLKYFSSPVRNKFMTKSNSSRRIKISDPDPN